MRRGRCSVCLKAEVLFVCETPQPGGGSGCTSCSACCRGHSSGPARLRGSPHSVGPAAEPVRLPGQPRVDVSALRFALARVGRRSVRRRVAAHHALTRPAGRARRWVKLVDVGRSNTGQSTRAQRRAPDASAMCALHRMPAAFAWGGVCVLGSSQLRWTSWRSATSGPVHARLLQRCSSWCRPRERSPGSSLASASRTGRELFALQRKREGPDHQASGRLTRPVGSVTVLQ